MSYPSGIYLVADTGIVPDPERLLYIVSEAIAGGVGSVQLRAKRWSDTDITRLATSMLRLTRPAGIPLLINDSVEAALASGADGVHVGQSDAAYDDVRRILGPEALIGLSVENLDQWEQALQPGLSYVAASPVFSTPTKTDTSPALGLEGLRYLADRSPIPVVAIGGIHTDNVADIARYGGHAAAVISAICLADNPRLATEILVKAFDQR